MSVLFVAALEEEAVALSRHVPVAVLGVGKVQAAAALARHLVERRTSVDLVVNVGTAGGLHAQPVGTIVEVVRVWQHDFDHAGASGLVGRDLPGGPIELTGPPGAAGRLVTGDRLVTDAAERQLLAREADLVDMEGYAVAATARALGCEVWLAKAVSDGTDGSTLVDWRAALDRCAEALARWAEERGLLDAG